MIRQSKKTDIELIKRYLDLSGADPNSYRLYKYLITGSTYHKCKVETRQEQIDVINKINNFDGIAIIYVYFEGDERVEDYVFPTHLDIYWDKSTEAKRIKRMIKVKSRMV